MRVEFASGYHKLLAEKQVGTENYVKIDHEPADQTIRVYDVNGETSERCFDYYYGGRDSALLQARRYGIKVAAELGCEVGEN